MPRFTGFVSDAQPPDRIPRRRARQVRRGRRGGAVAGEPSVLSLLDIGMADLSSIGRILLPFLAKLGAPTLAPNEILSSGGASSFGYIGVPLGGN